MKTWKNAEVVELNIAETANGLYPAMYEGIFGDCLCGNDANHGPLTGHNTSQENNNGNGSTTDPENSLS